MATQTKLAVGGADSGLTMPNPVKVEVTKESFKSTTANNTILSSPLVGQIAATVTTQNLQTLPLDEPETLQLTEFNMAYKHEPVSPLASVPDTTSLVVDMKQDVMDVDDPQHFYEVSELYDSWNYSTLDVELFPELF